MFRIPISFLSHPLAARAWAQITLLFPFAAASVLSVVLRLSAAVRHLPLASATRTCLPRANSAFFKK
ncbi:hypothetical protein [Methanimicrococcus hacksteinii]|uniref:hypothetical protein n=1 Tax=Methanimicrococcus hacksteinii TaxID=3028293 RepID=UPI00298EDCCA|nr:hypothetical protein [Methanimicrococcus sp. At1]